MSLTHFTRGALLALSLTLPGWSTSWASCALSNEVRIVSSARQGLFFATDEPATLLSQTAFNPDELPHVAGYQAFITTQVTPDQIALLERQRELFRRAFGEEEGRRYDRIISGEVGVLAPSVGASQFPEL